MVARDVFPEQAVQVPPAEDDHVIEDIAPTCRAETTDGGFIGPSVTGWESTPDGALGEARLLAHHRGSERSRTHRFVQ